MATQQGVADLNLILHKIESLVDKVNDVVKNNERIEENMALLHVRIDEVASQDKREQPSPPITSVIDGGNVTGSLREQPSSPPGQGGRQSMSYEREQPSSPPGQGGRQSMVYEREQPSSPPGQGGRQSRSYESSYRRDQPGSSLPHGRERQNDEFANEWDQPMSCPDGRQNTDYDLGYRYEREHPNSYGNMRQRPSPPRYQGLDQNDREHPWSQRQTYENEMANIANHWPEQSTFSHEQMGRIYGGYNANQNNRNSQYQDVSALVDSRNALHESRQRQGNECMPNLNDDHWPGNHVNRQQPFKSTGFGDQMSPDDMYQRRPMSEIGANGGGRSSVRPARYNTNTREDTNVRVKNFIPSEHSWIDYRLYFTNIAKKARWSDNTKCVKLMAALDAGLFGVTDGLGEDYTFDELVGKIDHMHGAEFTKRDALNELNYVKRAEGESIPIYGERVRRLTNRAYAGYFPNQIDELALQAFLDGLPSKQNFRLQMKAIPFRTLQEAINYASNYDQILRNERQNSGYGRSVEIEEFETIDLNEGHEFEAIRKAHEYVSKQLNRYEKRFNKHDRNKVAKPSTAEVEANDEPKGCPTCQSKGKDYKTRQNSPCHLCDEYGHWASECPLKAEIKAKFKKMRNKKRYPLAACHILFTFYFVYTVSYTPLTGDLRSIGGGGGGGEVLLGATGRGRSSMVAAAALPDVAVQAGIQAGGWVESAAGCTGENAQVGMGARPALACVMFSDAIIGVGEATCWKGKNVGDAALAP